MKIIQLCGQKQSGKTTTANYITGLVLQYYNIIQNFTIGTNGKLYIHAEMEINGKTQVSDGQLDMARRDDDFVQFAKHKIWPHVKIYNFADTLKYFCIDVLGLDESKMFGSDDDKNTKTHISWKEMPIPRSLKTAGERNIFLNKRGYMTNREILQVFGTDVCRSLHNKCWGESCFKKINEDQPEIAIIGDCRFEDELQIGIDNGANTIKHINTGNTDTHKSELALDNVKDEVYTYVMPDKACIDIKDKQNHIDLALVKCGLSYLL